MRSNDERHAEDLKVGHLDKNMFFLSKVEKKNLPKTQEQKTFYRWLNMKDEKQYVNSTLDLFLGGPVLYAYGNRAVNLHPFRWNTVALKTVFGLPFGTWHAAPKNDAVEDEFPCSKKWLLASQLFIVWEECFEWLCHAIPTCNSGFQSLSSTSAKRLKVYPFSHPLLLLWIPIRRLESPVTSSV